MRTHLLASALALVFVPGCAACPAGHKVSTILVCGEDKPDVHAEKLLQETSKENGGV